MKKVFRSLVSPTTIFVMCMLFMAYATTSRDLRWVITSGFMALMAFNMVLLTGLEIKVVTKKE